MKDPRFVEEVDIASLVDAKPNRDVLAYHLPFWTLRAYTAAREEGG